MKTKIGEKTSKSESQKGFFAKYPGAAILLALLIIAGVGFGVIKFINRDNEQPSDQEQPETHNSVDDSEDSEDEAADSQKPDEESYSPADEEDKDSENMNNENTETSDAATEQKPGETTSNQSGTDASGAKVPSKDPAKESSESSSAEKDKEASDKDSKTVPGSLSAKAKEHKDKVNNDTIGWIQVPNTNIDYPVVQYTDNTYYSARDYKKNASKNGVIYADYECNFKKGLATNNILYGHNWTNVFTPLRIGNPNDVMFAQLPSFHTLSFAQKTPFIYFSTTDKDYVWQVFAVFYTEDTFNYISAYPSTAQYKTILDEAKKRSIHNYNVNVSTSDQILTLSTCTRVYGQRSDQRFVIMAKRVNAGTPAATVTENPNFKRPQFKK